jgi:hypothetical protein
VAERFVHVDLVAIASSFTDARQIAGVFQNADDPLGCARGDGDAFGSIARFDVRFLGDADQHLGMVAEESPTGRSCHHFDASTPPGLDGSTRIR